MSCVRPSRTNEEMRQYMCLGYFTNEIDAARAYNAAVIAHNLRRPLNDIPEDEIGAPVSAKPLIPAPLSEVLMSFSEYPEAFVWTCDTCGHEAWFKPRNFWACVDELKARRWGFTPPHRGDD